MPKQIWLPTTETRVTVENGTVRIIDHITMTPETVEPKPLGFTEGDTGGVPPARKPKATS